jgi:hypothetical protein
MPVGKAPLRCHGHPFERHNIVSIATNVCCATKIDNPSGWCVLKCPQYDRRALVAKVPLSNYSNYEKDRPKGGPVIPFSHTVHNIHVFCVVIDGFTTARVCAAIETRHECVAQFIQLLCRRCIFANSSYACCAWCWADFSCGLAIVIWKNKASQTV